MSKTSVLWIALFALAGFVVLTVCLLVVIGALWFAKPAPRPVMEASLPARAPLTFGASATPAPPPPPAPAMAYTPPAAPPVPAVPADPQFDSRQTVGTPDLTPDASPLPPSARAATPPDSFTPPAPAAPNPPAMQSPIAPAPRPAPTPVAAPAATGVPTGYALVNATPSGKAIATEKSTPATVNDALEAGLDDLDDYFDDDYDVIGKYEDQKTHRAGVATFQAKYKGQAVKGFVMAHLRDKGAGATLVIVFANANVTQAEWARLTGLQAAPANNQNNPQPNQLANNAPARGQYQGQPQNQNPYQTQNAPQPPNRGQPQNNPQPPAQQVALRTYRFPDGTGSIDLAPGWTTNAQSCQAGFVITGPNDQKISMGMTLSVNTPNSTAVQLARQYPTNVPMVVAPYGEPANVIQALIPQLSTLQQRNGGPAVAIDHVATVKQLPSLNNAGKNALLTYGVTHSLNGRQAHYQAIAEVSVTPTSNESYMVWTIECAAPDATARQDIPLMLAMANSWKTNDAAIQQNTNTWVANSTAAFNAGQAANRDLQNTYSQYNAAQANNSVRQSRAVDNYIETIRGTRDIQDTTTGYTAPVELGNVDHIVDNLNQYDPGRYIQVPLRDQADPLPNR